ncbi:hypothetical protein INR49_001366 [Caranx melampygus]|nr:hypothetical protein INR49_001366 [Caranx melampygus]
MDLDLGIGSGAGLGTGQVPDGGLLDIKGDDGEFSSGSTSSNTSLRSSSSTLPPASASPTPDNVEEEKEALTGCSKSFTGLKLFRRVSKGRPEVD